MRRSFARVRGIGFIFWQARHEMFHALFGIAWAWLLREWWGEFKAKWVLLAIFGSLLPDAEHLYYFFVFRNKDRYAWQVNKGLRAHKWRFLAQFISEGHKNNTNLALHNIYIIALLFIGATIALLFDWNSWVVLIGAMIIHYLFDIVDDILTLGYVNPNWKRWGREKRRLAKKLPASKIVS